MRKQISIALACCIAVVFTLSCSGEDGRDGAGCEVKPKSSSDDDGYDVICGGELVGELFNGKDGKNGTNGKDGKNGTNGTNGKDGASCEVKPKSSSDDDGYNVICGGEVVGELFNGQNGSDGANGANGTDCAIAADASNSAYFVITCGATSEYLAKAYCGANAYDPQKMVCNSGILTFVFTDSRDNKKYKATVIGNQVWMAENLKYNASGSKCGDGSGLSDKNTSTCDTYGRLYNWATAMNISVDYNASLYNPSADTKYRGVCPDGWHIPNYGEWEELLRYVNVYDTAGVSVAGKYLKATDYWNDNGNGQDTYSFSALPGGGGYDGLLEDVGNFGIWWSANEVDINRAYNWIMYHNNDNTTWGTFPKSYLYSVRCLQN